VGGAPDEDQHPPQGIDQQMTLAALHLLAGVIAPVSP
jgi:hypothetical protein